MIMTILVLNIIIILFMVILISAVGGIKIGLDKSVETMQFMVYAASRQGQAAMGDAAVKSAAAVAEMQPDKSIVEQALLDRATGAIVEEPKHPQPQSESQLEQPAQSASDAPEAQPNV
jgi:hypothetical protein